MTTIKTFLKNNCLAIALAVSSAGSGFAQTVTVPANCTVITTNTATGGILGAGGIVTDGGVVAMPDPSGGGTFSFNAPAGATTIAWSFKGDLSTIVTSPYGGAIQTASGTSTTIISYNKNYRPTSTEQFNNSFARSKGLVRVNFDQTSCGKSISFQIFKSFNAALPQIVGPACLKPNTQYTYSVDQIVSDNANDAIGFDSYYWSGLPANITSLNSFYTSADSSSITFTTAATVTPFTLTCCYGRVNPNTADGGFSGINITTTPARTTCVSKMLLVAPVAPLYNIPPPACVPVGQATFNVNYPYAPVGQIYTWSSPNSGWTFANSTTATQTVIISTNGKNNPAKIILTITGTCDPAIFEYQVNRSIAAPTVEIIPSTGSSTCINPTSANTYTINASAVGVTLGWSTIPAGVTLPGLVPGITLQPSTNTNSVLITATGAAPGTTFTLVAKGAPTCGATSISTVINIAPLAPVFPTGSPTCVVRGGSNNTTIAVTAVAGATYNWVATVAGQSATGITCSAGCNTANPTLQFNSPTGTNSFQLAVKATLVNGCFGATTTRTINYVGMSTSISPGFPDQYLVSGACASVTSWTVGTSLGNTIYNQTATTVPVVVSSFNGGTNNLLTVSGSSGAPITSICATLTSGLVVCATSIGTLTQRLANTNNLNSTKLENVTISPNPNSGHFNIKVANYIESGTATLNDFDGNEVQTILIRKGDNKIDNEQLKKGTYFIVLNVDGVRETRQVIVK